MESFRRTAGVIALLGASFAACTRPPTAPGTALTAPPAATPDPLDPEDEGAAAWAFPPTTPAVARKRAWIARTVKLARGGRGISRKDPLDRWLSLSEERLVDELLADVRFADATLDFNLYFLGYRPDSLWTPSGELNGDWMAFPQAVRAAQALLPPAAAPAGPAPRYEDLFRFRQDVWPSTRLSNAPRDPRNPGTSLPVEHGLGLRAAWLDRWIARLGALSTLDAEEAKNFCSGYSGEFQVAAPNLPSPFFYGTLFDSEWGGPLLFQCFPALRDQPYTYGLPATLTELRRLRDREVRFARAISSGRLAAAEYAPKTVAELRSLGDLPPPRFGATFQLGLVNSSTNRDRRRAAWVLKRYFCDDLTPIVQLPPAQHVAERHASDPTCFACHYKLDPMAGFFRDLGLFFNDFKDRNLIIFDDGASARREAYVAPWKEGAPAGRTWNVGYVRSTRDPRLNDYGETLEDLERILVTAPEPRACLVKRFQQYALGEGQAIDPAYLRQLTERFARGMDAGRGADAFRELARTTLLSQAFRAEARVESRCYDRPTGAAPNAAIDGRPCRIAAIVDRACATCHSGAGAAGGLDFSRWNGPEEGGSFAHAAADGSAVAPRESWARIAERLTSADPARRMPLGADMPESDRGLLYRWAEARK